MIKTTIAGGLAALALTGCMSAQQQAADRAAYEDVETKLMEAQGRATLDCIGANACEKAWMLTKSYVQQQSGMSVRLSDDTLIETFPPAQYGMATFRATRVPEGQKMVIRLTGVCVGMYNRDGTQGPNYNECALKVGGAQNLFRKFVTERM